MMSKLRRKLQSVLSEKQNLILGYIGTLGKLDGTVAVPDNPNHAYVRMEDQPISEVYNTRVPYIPELRVIVGFDPLQPHLWQVLTEAPNYAYGVAGSEVPVIGPHGETHRWMGSGPRGGTDIVYVEKRQFMPLRITPGGGLTVFIHRDVIYTGIEFVEFSPTAVEDLSSYAPATADKANYVLLTIDNTGTLVITQGSEVDTVDLALTDIPSVPTDTVYIIAAVRLYEGQDDIEEGGTYTDIIDIRAYLIGSTSTGSGGGSDNRWVPGIFISTYFDETDESLHILHSEDGLDWTDVGISYGDTVRDPSVLYYGGKWWIAHTHDGAPTDVIPIISSEDMLSWSTVVELDTSAMGGSTQAWAPEWFIDDDGSVHLFMAIGSGTSHAIYETHPTNAAWTTWSNLAEVTGTGFPSDMIDPFLIKIDDTYYLFYKDDNTDYIAYATSTSLTSGYVEIEDGDWAGWGNNREGNCLVQIDNDTWRIYFNTTLTNGQYYSESSDNFGTWSSPTAISSLSDLSHGTVKQISDFAAFWSIRDLLGYGIGEIVESVGLARIGASVSRSTALSIPNATPTPITWNNEIIDHGGCWTAGDPTKLTAPVDGWYAITAFAWWDGDNDGGRRLYIRLNATTTIGRQSVVSPAAHNDVANSVSALYYLEAGEYVDVIADQNAGNALNIKSGAMAHFARVDGAAHLPYFSDDVSNPPTDAELDSAIGAPATVGQGYEALVDDGGTGNNVYRVTSDGTNWWYQTLTKAT